MGGLDAAQQAALLGILRTAARGEASAEALRRRLQDAGGCNPWLVFKSLQGSRPSKAWISSIDLFSWLSAQPHSVPNLAIEDLDAVMAPFAHVGHELRYQDFLRMFLPRDDSRTNFSQERPSPLCDASQSIPPETAHRLCELITSEIDVARHLRHHRKKLLELGIGTVDAARFLNADADLGSCSMISPSHVRQVLVDRHHALDVQQCEALLRRINPSGSCMAPVDELAKLLTDASQNGSWSGGLSLVDGHTVHGRPHNQPQSAAAPARVPPMLRDPGTVPNRPSSPSPRWNGHSWDSPGPSARAIPAVSWSSPLQSPASGDRSWHTQPSISKDAHQGLYEPSSHHQHHHTQGWGEPSSPALQRNRNAQPWGEPSSPAFHQNREAQQRGTPSSPAFQSNRGAQLWGEPSSSAKRNPEAQRWGESSTPMRSPANEWQSTVFGDTPGQDMWSARSIKDYKLLRSPDARSALASTQASTADYMSPKSPGRFSSPHSYRTPRHNWRDLSICDQPSSPLRLSSPTRALSPSRVSPPLRASSPSRSASPTRTAPHLRTASPSRMASPRRMASPSRATSVPLAGVSWKPSASAYSPRPETPRRVGGGYSYEPPVRPGSLIQAQRDSRKQNVMAVLQNLAKQAELDAQLEEAKEMLPPGICLESIFNMLDRFHKGYITDMDMWQFCQDFGAVTPYGSFCALAQDVLLRIHRQGNVNALNHLSMRDLGTLVFPLHSQEHKEMREANSDAEAMSILYLLRNSEACPGCGVRVQRDADAAGCPSVTCPRCGAAFRCFVVVSDYASPPDASAPLAASAQYHVHKFIDAAAHVAQELDAGRRRCVNTPNYDTVSALSDVFTQIVVGKLSFTMGDLRRALFAQDICVSEQHLALALRRYAPNGREVSFLDFARQLKAS